MIDPYQGAISHPSLHPFPDHISSFQDALLDEKAITLLSIKNGAIWEEFFLKKSVK